MNVFEVLAKQIDEKIEQLQDFVSSGRPDTYEEYKRMCGEIRGLLIARGYILDLEKRMEHSDE
jgi:hypothetical protein